MSAPRTGSGFGARRPDAVPGGAEGPTDSATPYGQQWGRSGGAVVLRVTYDLRGPVDAIVRG